MLKSKTMLVVDVRQVALINETMSSLSDAESIHSSRRISTAKVRDECAGLLGRDLF